MRLHTYLTVLLALALGACVAPGPVPMESGGFEPSSLESGPIESVDLYNPDGLDPAIDYVREMRADLLSPELDQIDFDADREAAIEQLDTPEQAFLMMAAAGMEYYPVSEPGEGDLNETIRSVVEGNGDTGLTMLDPVIQPLVGFRADVVRVNDRPHFIVSIRGTQIKQPSFIQAFANGIADLTTVAVQPDEYGLYSTRVNSLSDLIGLNGAIRRAANRADFSDRNPRVHAGIYAASLTLFQGVRDRLAGHLGLEFGRVRPDDVVTPETPCVWITGHSLGGGMAPLLAYRLAQDAEFTSNGGRICGVYTYGAPRVGNYAFARQYNRTEIGADESVDLGSVTFRYQMQDDVIPHLPPNVPMRGSVEVANLVAENIMAVAIAHAPYLEQFEQWLEAGADPAALSDDQARVAGLLFGGGQLLRDVYRIMKENGALDRVGSFGYRLARNEIRSLIVRFRGIQHVGHTRWIRNRAPGEFDMPTGSPTQQHHLEWMLSYSHQTHRAVCADAVATGHENVRQHVSNSLGYHRVPFYAAALLDFANHRFPYPDSDVSDRLRDGVDFYYLENFERQVAELLDEERGIYLSCSATAEMEAEDQAAADAAGVNSPPEGEGE